MSTKTLFLAWQDQDKRKKSHPWFPVGRLDIIEPELYRFRYIGGAKLAGYIPFIDFPELYGDYRSSELFALFRNRVIAQGRPDRMAYLSNLDLPEDASPVEILSVNGGTRVTDAYEVFPKLEKDADGYFTCRFFLHSWQHASKEAQERINYLKARRRTLRNPRIDQSGDQAGSPNPDDGLLYDRLDAALSRERFGHGDDRRPQ